MNELPRGRLPRLAAAGRHCVRARLGNALRLAEVLRPDWPVMTYRCRACKALVVLRARDVYLAECASEARAVAEAMARR